MYDSVLPQKPHDDDDDDEHSNWSLFFAKTKNRYAFICLDMLKHRDTGGNIVEV